MAKKLKPKPGEVYKDFEGRTFKVTTVTPGDGLGREVVGKYRLKGSRKWENFSTTLEMWASTWRDKREPTPIGRLKIG